MLSKLLSLENLEGNYQKLQNNVDDGIKTLSYGLPTTARYHLAGFLRGAKLFICHNKLEADEAIINFNSIVGEENVVYIPSKPEVLLHASAFSKDLLFERMTAIHKLATKNIEIVVVTVECLMSIMPAFEDFKNKCSKLLKAQEISPKKVMEKLVSCGYLREELIDGQGQFSLRGDILDVFLIDGNAVRIDFFGDNIELIKEIDTETMKSSGDIESIDLYPIYDVLLDNVDTKKLMKKVRANLPKVTESEKEQSWERILEEIELEISTTLTSQQGELLPLLENTSTLFNYLDKETIIVFNEFNKCMDIADSQQMEHKSRYTSLFEGGQILKSQLNQLINFNDAVDISNDFPSIAFMDFLATDKGFYPRELLEFKTTPIVSYQKGNEELVIDIKNWLKYGYTVAICGKDVETSKNLTKDISNDGGMVAFQENSDSEITGCVIVPVYLSHGFIIQDKKIVVVGSLDVLKKTNRRITPKKKKNDAFLSCEVGDFIVHEVHGIGLLKSISTIKTGNIVKDYAVVEYRGGDTLYVPAEQMDILVKFSGNDSSPHLSKIGGKEFENVKARVRESIRKMAIDLKELYAKREHQKGYVYQADSVFQAEFEEAFPHEPTADQLLSTSEIKGDMTSGKVMDRLLVGDVGYGKTEVAFRACFKAIESGKQVCILAPTTILSYQHYQTALKRFDGFGIRIDYLNRFKSTKEQTKTLLNLQQGKVDLIIGTHRLLSKDVEFFDLGLLVLDEEQRFGVESKEKIKNLKNDIDVLSMSATPIPRTLHMSLSGIRDISTIETPPSKRLPVQVMVSEQSDILMRDAIIRELARGGQAFVLYNRVASIYTFAKRLADLIPNAKILVAHGKMQPTVLEDSIEKFVLGEADILLSTTIIENGIDIPKANTMLVVDSDKFGLSQLYQLKGRVGRSDKLAYVYYLFQQNKVLSETAQKRLRAIKEFTEFGSGFKIAMRDLEIRGSGSILGREQHGHMESVGYDMYCKLLRESVDELDGKVIMRVETEMEVDISAYIPESYITLSSARMEQYRMISGITSVADIKNIITGMADIYGKVPKVIDSLCKISYLRHQGAKLFATKIIIKEGKSQVVLTLESMKNEKLHEFINDHKNIVELKVGESLILEIKEKEQSRAIKILCKIMENMNL